MQNLSSVTRTAQNQVETQMAESLQNAPASFPSKAIANIGIQIQKTQYYLLFKIDGFVLWQFFGQVRRLKDKLEITKRPNMHYFLRPSFKGFLEFCLNNFEVIF